MIKALLNGIMTFVSALVTALLAPINTMITTVFPSGAEVLSKVSNFFDYLEQFAPFALSYLGLTTTTISLMVFLIGACVTLPIGIHGIKLAIRWYNALVP